MVVVVFCSNCGCLSQVSENSNFRISVEHSPLCRKGELHNFWVNQNVIHQYVLVEVCGLDELVGWNLWIIFLIGNEIKQQYSEQKQHSKGL